MSLNITSKQTTIKLGPHKGEEMYVMKVSHYSTLGAEKIIGYASEPSNIPKAMCGHCGKPWIVFGKL